MVSYLVKHTGSSEFFTDERCFITELCNTGSLDEGSLAIARVEPGVTTQLHSLSGITETYIVIEGVGLMDVGGETFPVGPGDQVVIPADVAQRVTNQGETDFRFYCLCTPRFRPDTYVNLEAS